MSPRLSRAVRRMLRRQSAAVAAAARMCATAAERRRRDATPAGDAATHDKASVESQIVADIMREDPELTLEECRRAVQVRCVPQNPAQLAEFDMVCTTSSTYEACALLFLPRGCRAKGQRKHSTRLDLHLAAHSQRWRAFRCGRVLRQFKRCSALLRQHQGYGR